MTGGVMRDLAKRLGEALSGAGRTIAVAESCTGGGLCSAITDIPGSSAYFLGGIVAYHDEVKTRELGVPDGLIRSDGAVSETVAISMAEGARMRFGADIGVGVTGIAGPGGGTAAKPVGTVCMGISADGVRYSGRMIFHGDRESVRGQAVAWALAELLRRSAGGSGEKK